MSLIVSVCLTGCLHRIPSKYSGHWVFRSGNKNILLLKPQVHGSLIRNSLTTPMHFREDGGGNIGGSRPIVTRPVTGLLAKGHVELKVGTKPNRDRMRMASPDADHDYLNVFSGTVPDLKLDRVSAGRSVIVSDDWPSENAEQQFCDSIRKSCPSCVNGARSSLHFVKSVKGSASRQGWIPAQRSARLGSL